MRSKITLETDAKLKVSGMTNRMRRMRKLSLIPLKKVNPLCPQVSFSGTHKIKDRGVKSKHGRNKDTKDVELVWTQYVPRPILVSQQEEEEEGAEGIDRKAAWNQGSHRRAEICQTRGGNAVIKVLLGTDPRLSVRGYQEEVWGSGGNGYEGSSSSVLY